MPLRNPPHALPRVYWHEGHPDENHPTPGWYVEWINHEISGPWESYSVAMELAKRQGGYIE